jgi:hypothetical protein
MDRISRENQINTINATKDTRDIMLPIDVDVKKCMCEFNP